jgi:hypothetical protein
MRGPSASDDGAVPGSFAGARPWDQGEARTTESS